MGSEYTVNMELSLQASRREEEVRLGLVEDRGTSWGWHLRQWIDSKMAEFKSLPFKDQPTLREIKDIFCARGVPIPVFERVVMGHGRASRREAA